MGQKPSPALFEDECYRQSPRAPQSLGSRSPEPLMSTQRADLVGGKNHPSIPHVPPERRATDPQGETCDADFQFPWKFQRHNAPNAQNEAVRERTVVGREDKNAVWTSFAGSQQREKVQVTATMAGCLVLEFCTPHGNLTKGSGFCLREIQEEEGKEIQTLLSPRALKHSSESPHIHCLWLLPILFKAVKIWSKKLPREEKSREKKKKERQKGKPLRGLHLQPEHISILVIVLVSHIDSEQLLTIIQGHHLFNRA